METVPTRSWLQNGRHALGMVSLVVISLLHSNLATSQTTSMIEESSVKTIALGAGCFWCVEAVFEQLNGVLSAESGYMGGHIKNPAYREVCTGRTGHAEVVKVTYDADKIGLASLLDVFFATHDPTTLNRQGADVGTQYRSAIFYNSEDERQVAHSAIEKAQSRYTAKIVTEVSPVEPFYPAEDYHQAYYELNGEAPYCKAVIAPKMKKFRSEFEPLLKLN